MRNVRFKIERRCPHCHEPVTCDRTDVVKNDDGVVAHKRCIMNAFREEVIDAMGDVFSALEHEDMRRPFSEAMRAEDLPWRAFVTLIEQALQKMYATECESEMEEFARMHALQGVAKVFSRELMVEVSCESPDACRERERRIVEQRRMN